MERDETLTKTDADLAFAARNRRTSAFEDQKTPSKSKQLEQKADKAPTGAGAKNARGQEESMNFASLGEIKVPNDIPLPPIKLFSGQGRKNGQKIIEEAIAFLDADGLSSYEFQLNENDGRELKFSFFSDEPRYEDDYDDDDYYDDSFDDDDQLEDLLVTVAETKPDGELELRCSRPFDEAGLEVVGALYLTWLIVAPNATAATGSWRPPDLNGMRRKFKNLDKVLEERKNRHAKTLQWLDNTRLESLVLALPPNLCDGQPIHSLRPRHELPDEIQFKAEPEFKTWAFDDFRVVLGDKDLSGLTNRVPSYFRTGEFEKPAYFFAVDPREKANLRRIAETVSYRFSDGTVVSAGEIWRGPYALLVPPDLLPGKVELSAAKKFWSKSFSSAQAGSPASESEHHADETFLFASPESVNRFPFRSPQRRNTEKAILEIVIACAERSNRGELAVELVFAPADPDVELWRGGKKKRTSPAMMKIPALRLKRIENKATCLFAWKVIHGVRHLSGSPELKVPVAQFVAEPTPDIHGDERQLLPLGCGFLDREGRTLWLRSLNRERAMLQRFTHGPDESFSPDDDGVRLEIKTNPQYEVRFIARGRQAILDLENGLKSQSGHLYEFEETGKLSEVRAVPEIHVGADGRFRLARHLDPVAGSEAIGDDPFINGLSDKTLHLLRTLSRGLAWYFGGEAREMAARTKRNRDFELKLLKHQGVLNLMLYESLSVRLFGRMSDGEKVSSPEKILTRLEGKILLLLGENPDSGKRGTDISSYCTRAARDRVIRFIATCLGRARDEDMVFVTAKGKITLPDFHEAESRLLFVLLEFAALASKGEIFAKARMNLLEKIFPFPEERLRELKLTVSRERRDLLHSSTSDEVYFVLPFGAPPSEAAVRQALTVFQGDATAGMDCYFGTQRLRELGENEFRAELALADATAATTPVKDRNGKSDNGVLRARRMDWFELHPKFFLHGREMTESEALRLIDSGMIEHQGQFYLIPTKRMPSLRKLSLFWDKLRQGKRGRGPDTGLTEKVYPLAKSQALEMLALRASGIPVIGGERWQDICEFYDKMEDTSARNRDLSVPTSVRANLKDYQKIGVRRLYDLYRLGLGGILADDMGLGKTLQALAFLEKLRREGRMGRVLIVVPTSLTYNWIGERDKFVPDVPIFSFAAKAKDACADFMAGVNSGSAENGGENASGSDGGSGAAVLVTYGLLQEHADFFRQYDWNVILFDEAQNLKNIAAQRTTTARSLEAKVKIALTGTPLENHLGEFYSLLDLVVPGCLGDLEDFRKTYVNPDVIQHDDIRFLKLKAKPLVLRRTKNEILTELPDKRESRVVLPFEAKQKKIYRDIALSYNDKIQVAVRDKGEAKCQLQMLTALLRLRQACSDPASLPDVKYAPTPPKLEALVEALTEIVDSGGSALVFTQFLNTLTRAEKILSAAAVPVFTLHGGLARANREKVLRDFHSVQGGAVLLMTLKTGGVGLNLTKASYVFHLEPWWNPAVENQATDRAHRMGQTSSVQVYRYIMHESVEEKIERLKGQKQKFFNSLFSKGEDPNSAAGGEAESKSEGTSRKGGHLSHEDFEFLLS